MIEFRRSGRVFTTLAKIRSEGHKRSQVAPVFDMLTVTIGPRLTASPAHKRAAEWTRELSAGLNAEEVSRLMTLDMDVQRSERLQPLRTLTVDGQRLFEMLPNKWNPCTI